MVLAARYTRLVKMKKSTVKNLHCREGRYAQRIQDSQIFSHLWVFGVQMGDPSSIFTVFFRMIGAEGDAKLKTYAQLYRGYLLDF